MTVRGVLTMYVAIADRVGNDGLSLQIAQQLEDVLLAEISEG